MFVIRRRITFLLKIIAIHFYLVSNKKLESSNKQNWICCCSSIRFWWIFFKIWFRQKKPLEYSKKQSFCLVNTCGHKKLKELGRNTFVIDCFAMSAVVSKSPRTQMTTVEPWEVAYFNGAALLDEIPVGNRDTHEQYALRDHSQPAQEVKVKKYFPSF